MRNTCKRAVKCDKIKPMWHSIMQMGNKEDSILKIITQLNKSKGEYLAQSKIRQAINT